MDGQAVEIQGPWRVQYVVGLQFCLVVRLYSGTGIVIYRGASPPAPLDKPVHVSPSAAYMVMHPVVFDSWKEAMGGEEYYYDQ